MNCIRCAKETEENHIFCNECLQDMERHPVDPRTPIQLPHRPEQPVIKRSSFRLAASKWEDKIFRLKHIVAWLVVLNILLVLALIFCVCVMLHITPQWLNDRLGLTTIRDAIESYMR